MADPETGPKGPEKGKEQPEATKHMGREGGRLVEVLEVSTDPRQLIDASRAYMTMFENMNLHPDGTVAEWSMDQVKSSVEARKVAIGYSIQDLEDLGYVTYDEKKNALLQYPGYAYNTIIEYKPGTQTVAVDEKGEIVPGSTRVNLEPTPVYLPGEKKKTDRETIDKQREALVEVLSSVDGEMTAREDLVKMMRFVWGQTENLEGLVQFYYKGSLTNESMRLLCDAEGRFKITEKGERESFLKKTEGGVEYRERHGFGDAIGASLKCLEIAAKSEKYEEFRDLITRPGIKHLFNVADEDIDNLFVEGSKRTKQINSTLLKWIGDPSTWNKVPVEIINKKDGVRGLLTKNGNILVESSWPDALELFGYIDEFIGGEKKSVKEEHIPGKKSTIASKEATEARSMAWEILRVTGMATDLGGQPYRLDKDDNLNRKADIYIHHEMGGMTSCDRVKVMKPNVFTAAYRYLKQMTQGYGPDGSFGKMPDRFTVPYLKNWTGKGVEIDTNGDPMMVPDLDKDGNIQLEDNGDIKKKEKKIGKRSFDEMLWGYRAKLGTNYLTDKPIILPGEKAFHLGELPWKELTPKAYNVASLGPYIAGREGIGLYQYMMKTDWDIKQLKDKTFFEKLAANIRLSMNAQTAFDGKFRGIYDGVTELGETALSKEDKKDQAKVVAANNLKKQFDTKVDDAVRNYRKGYVTAFWDGIRSLPQYKEWLADKPDVIANGANTTSKKANVSPVARIVYSLKGMGVFTKEEIKKMAQSLEPIGEFEDWQR